MENKPKGYGAWTPERVIRACEGTMMAQRGDGTWVPSKPLPYYSFIERLQQAWDVLRYRADALYWYFPEGIERPRAPEKMWSPDPIGHALRK